MGRFQHNDTWGTSEHPETPLVALLRLVMESYGASSAVESARAISSHNSAHGMSRSISLRNWARLVVFPYSSNPSPKVSCLLNWST